MSKKERRLTSAELRRKKRFQQLCGEMRRQGYREHDLTIGAFQANLMAVLLTLPVLPLSAWAYFVLHPTGGSSWNFGGLDSLLLLLLFLLLVGLHEAIHGLTWAVFAKNHLRSIEFGVIWRALVPYCTCGDPLKRGQYILGTAMPTLLLGFLPAVAAILGGWPWLLFLADVMIISGGGDLCIIWKVLLYRPESKDVLYCDHPYEGGVVVFERK